MDMNIGESNWKHITIIFKYDTTLYVIQAQDKSGKIKLFGVACIVEKNQ